MLTTFRRPIWRRSSWSRPLNARGWVAVYILVLVALALFLALAA